MFDKEISHYNIIVYDYVSEKGTYRILKTIKRSTEEAAVECARKELVGNRKVKIEQVQYLVNWN